MFDEVKLIFADGVTCDAGCVRIERIRQGPWQAQTCRYSMRSDVICLTSWSPALSPNFFQMRVLSCMMNDGCLDDTRSEDVTEKYVY